MEMKSRMISFDPLIRNLQTGFSENDRSIKDLVHDTMQTVRLHEIINKHGLNYTQKAPYSVTKPKYFFIKWTII